MHAALRHALAVALGALLGVASVKPTLLLLADRAALHDGPWQTMTGAGSADASPFVRSAVAVAGLWALPASETIYYTAFNDSGGARLDGACTYRIAGPAPAARWWSFTVYGADHFLVANEAGIYSRTRTQLLRDGSSTIAFEAGPQRTSPDWLPTPAGAPFSITLRLYNPAPAVSADPAHAPLPAIERLSCAGSGS